jgi:hypothetical protein
MDHQGGHIAPPFDPAHPGIALIAVFPPGIQGAGGGANLMIIDAHMGHRKCEFSDLFLQ